MKVTLFIMTKKGLESLRMIIDTFGPEIIDTVYMSRDKNVVEDYYEAIEDLCTEYEIPHYDRGDECIINTEYALAISWRWLIKTDKTVIVLHDSFLPKYRGYAPITNALIDKAPMLGVTAFIANGTPDAGPIIRRLPVSIDYPIKIHEAIDKTLPAYCQLCDFVISSLERNGTVDAESQNEKEASYGMWRDELDYIIDWNWPAQEIVTFVNAVGFPYNGAFTSTDYWEEAINVLDCEIFPDVNIINRERHIGKVFCIDDGKYVVITGDGLLKITNAFIGKERKLKPSKLRVRFT